MERNKIEFKAFDRVLVRDMKDENWKAAIYDQYWADNGDYPHRVIGDGFFCQCIPYEGNEHLLGTVNKYVPEPTGKNEPDPWKPKEGERYYRITWSVHSGFFAIGSDWDEREPFDVGCLKVGNCFRTKEEAQEVIDRMNEALDGILSCVPGRLFDR